MPKPVKKNAQAAATPQPPVAPPPQMAQQRPATGGGQVAATKLFVGCLPYSKTEADLQPIFSQFGPVVEVAILKDGMTGTSKGAGFVTFEDAGHAATAMNVLQGHVFEGSTRGINLSFAVQGGGQKANTAGNFKVSPMGQTAAQRGSNMPSMPGTKIFVGQLPYSRGEADLVQLFSAIGPVVEVCLLKDKKTQEKKGAAFVRFSTPQHAAAAATTLDGFLFSGSTRPISVSLAHDSGGPGFVPFVPSELGQLAGKRATPGVAAMESEPGAKLFVGQLPFSKTEEDLRQLFSDYGTVAEVLLHRDAAGQKKGGAFVRFTTVEEAQSALDLDGHLFEGATRPISVMIAGGGDAVTGKKKRRTD